MLIALVATPVGAEGTQPLLTSYTAVASAQLVNVTYTTVPAVVFDPLLDSGASVAQASTDALGRSRGYAASQNPGTVFNTLGGTLGTVTGGVVGEKQVPKNPVAVHSDYPLRQQDTKRVGSVDLSSRSSAASGDARASDGTSTADASVDVDTATGTLRAGAVSTVQSVSVDPLLTVSGIRSSASITRSGDGHVTRKSDFEVASLDVMGSRIALTRDELTALNNNVSTGTTIQSTLKPLLETLAANGVRLAFFPESATGTSVRSAGLTITATVPLSAPAGGLQRAVVTYVLGGALAAVDAGSTTQQPGVAVSPSSPDTGVASAAQPAGPLDGSRGVLPVAAPAATAPAMAAGSSQERSALRGLALPVYSSLTSFYLALVVAAAVLVTAARLHRHLTGGPG